MNIWVLGAGNFGTTLGNLLANKGYKIKIWTIEKDVFENINLGENKKYLSGVKLSENLSAVMDLKDVENADIIIVAIPSKYVEEVVKKLKPYYKNQIIVDVAKGIGKSMLRMSEIIEKEIPNARIVGLSGPSIANELSRGTPTSVTIASKDDEALDIVKEVFTTDHFKVHPCNDLIGMELGGVFKNIIAIGVGICDGLGFGINTKAALITNGSKELMKLSEAMGADKETFNELCWLGDLIATCLSKHSRNRTLGEKIGSGKSLEQSLKEMTQVTEGVAATKMALELAKKHKIKLLIIEKINDILLGKLPADAIKTCL